MSKPVENLYQSKKNYRRVGEGKVGIWIIG